MDKIAENINFMDVDFKDSEVLDRPPFRRRRSPLIVTMSDPKITSVDVQKLMEAGMNVARFPTSYTTKGEKIRMIATVDKAAAVLSSKYGTLDFPIATCVELKTCIVKTGILEMGESFILLKKGSLVYLSNDLQEFNKCNEHRIFVDNPNLTLEIKIGTEICIAQEEIIVQCKEICDDKSLKCLVLKGGKLSNLSYVSARGVYHSRPYVTKKDLQIVRFALEYQVDMIIINYTRSKITVEKVKRYVGRRKRPLLLCGICTSEGLSNIDDIIKEADGILLSREFLAYELDAKDKGKMFQIQKMIGAKCRQESFFSMPRRSNNINLCSRGRPVVKGDTRTLALVTQVPVPQWDSSVSAMPKVSQTFIGDGNCLLLSGPQLGLRNNSAIKNHDDKREWMYHWRAFTFTFQAGKPFYISGGIFQKALLHGEVSMHEVNDVTNAILDGVTGFVLKDNDDVELTIDAIKMMNELCCYVETLTNNKIDFWRILDETKMPVNAAEAAAMSCALAANQTAARVIVLPTVTGRTAKELMRYRPNCIIITVSNKLSTTRLLTTYRCVVPLIYNNPPGKSWEDTIKSKINFAIEYAIKPGWLEYGDPYVVLYKRSECSSFCDTVSIFNMFLTKRARVECPDDGEDVIIDE